MEHKKEAGSDVREADEKVEIKVGNTCVTITTDGISITVQAQ